MPLKSLTFRFLGGNSRDAVIGTKNFTAYSQNKNSCANAIRNQSAAAPLSLFGSKVLPTYSVDPSVCVNVGVGWGGGIKPF